MLRTLASSHATYVELRTTVGRCNVQGDSLHANEVLARGEVLRECEGDSGDALSGEGDATTTVGHRGDLVHLEPHVAVAREVRDVARSLRHVHVHDTGVVDRAVGHDAELGACLDGDRLRGRVRLRVVAPEVGRGHIGDRGLGVEVVCLPDVHPRGRRRAPYDEGREGV